MAPRHLGNDRHRSKSPFLYDHAGRTAAARGRRTSVGVPDSGGRQSAAVRVNEDTAMSPLRRFWNLLRRPHLDNELREEIETHLALIEEDERRNGRDAEQALQRAKSRFGN